jgi:hypothetical protein
VRSPGRVRAGNGERAAGNAVLDGGTAGPRSSGGLEWAQSLQVSVP